MLSTAFLLFSQIPSWAFSRVRFSFAFLMENSKGQKMLKKIIIWVYTPNYSCTEFHTSSPFFNTEAY